MYFVINMSVIYNLKENKFFVVMWHESFFKGPFLHDEFHTICRHDRYFDETSFACEKSNLPFLIIYLYITVQTQEMDYQV